MTSQLKSADFELVMSLRTTFFGDRFCMSRKGGGGGWVHPKGTNSMAASGLGTGWAISPPLHELAYKTDFCLVAPPFLKM